MRIKTQRIAPGDLRNFPATVERLRAAVEAHILAGAEAIGWSAAFDEEIGGDDARVTTKEVEAAEQFADEAAEDAVQEAALHLAESSLEVESTILHDASVLFERDRQRVLRLSAREVPEEKDLRRRLATEAARFHKAYGFNEHGIGVGNSRLLDDEQTPVVDEMAAAWEAVRRLCKEAESLRARK